MASPSYAHNYPSAISPPYPSHAQLPQPQKRRQSEMPTSAPAIKRRKASMLSVTSATSSAHPLRQTSFPPEHNGRTPAFSRSPSMDTMSLVSGSGAKKKKPRKSKVREMDNASARDDRAKSAFSNDGRGKRGMTVEEDEEEDGGEEIKLNVAATKEERAKEEKRRAMLTTAFDAQQFSRYEAWRSSKLADSVVRRIVNQTLSQSVPPSVILAVKSAAKIFAGEMIEGARKVQTQWIESTGDPQVITTRPQPPGIKETRRGPLLPDHLRESFRRHMLEGNNGLVGELGLWNTQHHSGAERFGTKVQGKRLMK